MLSLALLAGPAVGGEIELHDREGRVIQRTDETGVTTWYVYDESGRLAEERRSDGTVIRYDEGEPQRQSAPR